MPYTSAKAGVQGIFVYSIWVRYILRIVCIAAVPFLGFSIVQHFVRGLSRLCVKRSCCAILFQFIITQKRANVNRNHLN